MAGQNPTGPQKLIDPNVDNWLEKRRRKQFEMERKAVASTNKAFTFRQQLDAVDAQQVRDHHKLQHQRSSDMSLTAGDRQTQETYVSGAPVPTLREDQDPSQYLLEDLMPENIGHLRPPSLPFSGGSTAPALSTSAGAHAVVPAVSGAGAVADFYSTSIPALGHDKYRRQGQAPTGDILPAAAPLPPGGGASLPAATDRPPSASSMEAMRQAMSSKQWSETVRAKKQYDAQREQAMKYEAAIKAETEAARQEAERMRAEALMLKKEAEAQQADFAYKARQQNATTRQMQEEHKVMQTQVAKRVFEEQKRLVLEHEQMKMDIAAEMQTKEEALAARHRLMDLEMKEREAALLEETRSLQQTMIQEMHSRTQVEIEKVVREERERAQKELETVRQQSEQVIKGHSRSMERAASRMDQLETEYKRSIVEQKMNYAVQMVENSVSPRDGGGLDEVEYEAAMSNAAQMIKKVHEVGEELVDTIAAEGEGRVRSRAGAKQPAASGLNWAGVPGAKRLNQEEVIMEILDETSGPRALGECCFRTQRGISFFFKLALLGGVIFGATLINWPDLISDNPYSEWVSANASHKPIMPAVPAVPGQEGVVEHVQFMDPAVAVQSMALEQPQMGVQSMALEQPQLAVGAAVDGAAPCIDVPNPDGTITPCQSLLEGLPEVLMPEPQAIGSAATEVPAPQPVAQKQTSHKERQGISLSGIQAWTQAWTQATGDKRR